MKHSFSVQEAARAANVTRRQLDAWISRGYLAPEKTPQPGGAREYSTADIIEIAVLAELIRLGLGGPRIAGAAGNLHALKGDQAVLVIWQGPVELIPATPRGAAPDPAIKGRKFYDPDNAPLGRAIVPHSKVAELVADPDKRALVMVNIDHVEQRVRKALSAG